MVHFAYVKFISQANKHEPSDLTGWSDVYSHEDITSTSFFVDPDVHILFHILTYWLKDPLPYHSVFETS